MKHLVKNSLPVAGFKWRQKGGVFISPSEMETRNIYFSLRMIWNHRMPENAKLRPYREYEFNIFYTDQYFTDAIYHLSRELKTRTDMRDIWVFELNQMIEYLSSDKYISATPC